MGLPAGGERRIVGVAPRPRRVESRHVQGVRRRIGLHARHQIGVGDEGAGKGNQIRVTSLERTLGTGLVESSRQNEHTLERCAEAQLQVGGHGRRTQGRVVQQVNIQNALLRQFFGEGQVLRLDLGVGTRAVEHAVGRQPDAHQICADGGDRGTNHLQCEAVAAIDAAPIRIGAPVHIGV